MAVIMSQATRTLDKIADYALNNKEDQVGDRYVVATGVGCHPTTFKEQSRSDRRRAKKSKGYVEGYALVQSFAKYELDPTKPEDWERANELGVAIAKAIAGGRPCIIVTQLDGKSGCLHNHIVISSVHPLTGRSFDSSAVTHGVLARTHDQVLAANDFTQTTELKAHRQLHDSTKKIAMRANGQYIWTDDLTARIETALADPRSIDDAGFLAVLAENGVDVGPNPDRSEKDWTFGMADAEKTNNEGAPVYRKSRGSRLAAKLTKPAIRQQLTQNQHQKTPTIAQVLAPAPARPTIRDTYRAIFGTQENIDVPAIAHALADAQASAPATAIHPIEIIDDAPPVSAPAPTEEVAVVSAPAALTSGEMAYVSPLRKLRPKKADAKLDELRLALADFDEETRERLSAGERPIEAHVPKGLGPRSLAIFGPHMDDGVRHQLQLRETKRHEARVTLYEEGKVAAAKLKELRAEGKQWDDEFQALDLKRRSADHRRKRLLEEIEQGIYEPARGKAQGFGRSGTPALKPTPRLSQEDPELGE